MTDSQPKLSGKSLAILEMIAAGSSYQQILAAYPDLTYLDIFRAAEEALEIGSCVNRQLAYTVAQKRERYPRAYEKWAKDEEITLRKLVQSGATIAQIATQLQRNRGAIRSRVLKLGLADKLPPKEQERLRRIIEHNGEYSDE